MPDEKYQRLTRARSRSVFVLVARRSSLWLGSDHLLRIDTTGYTESYKRFYFRDIQAILFRKTTRWLIWAAIFGSCAAISALILLSSQEAVVRWIFGSLAALFFLALALDVAGGPTCVCQLRTAVQTEPLVSLKRVRRARRFLARLRPLIAQAQGHLAPEDIPGLMQQLADTETGPVPGLAAAPRFVTDDPNAPPRILSSDQTI